MRAWLSLPLTAVTLVASACLVNETDTVLYLDPDGAITWCATERQVRSDAVDAQERAAEETRYAQMVAEDRHPLAEAFRQFGSTAVTTTALRAARPFDTRVEGRFVGLSEIWGGIADACGLSHTASIEHTGDITTWTIILSVPSPQPESSCEGPVSDALALLLDSPVVLGSGTFVHAEGFSIDEGGRARLGKDAVAQLEAIEDQGPVVLALTWRR